MGRKKEALLLENAVRQAREKERFRISSTGRVEGGAKLAASILKEEVERCSI